MLSRLRDFVTRHRRKFIVTGIVVGGTYFAIRYAQHKLIEFQERQTREFLEKTRRIKHFEATEGTCNQVILGMGAELCEAIIRECGTEELLEQLRQNPANKLDLWEELKIVAFTRLTTFIYAPSMLAIALRVQLNLLGGYLYRDITTEQKQISDELKQQYLSLIRHFIHEGGLTALVRHIRSKVIATMKNISLSKRLSLADLEQLFWSLQMSINSDVEGDPSAKMSKYLYPAQVPEYNADGPLLQKMYNETLDLLETDDAATICSNNICRGFSLTVDAIAEGLGETLMLAQNQATDSVTAIDFNNQSLGDGDQNLTAENAGMRHNNTLLNINKVEIALAKLIPIVNGLTSKGFDSKTRPQNLATSLVTFYVVAEKTKVLGANVYETFSSTSGGK